MPGIGHNEQAYYLGQAGAVHRLMHCIHMSRVHPVTQLHMTHRTGKAGWKGHQHKILMWNVPTVACHMLVLLGLLHIRDWRMQSHRQRQQRLTKATSQYSVKGPTFCQYFCQQFQPDVFPNICQKFHLQVQLSGVVISQPGQAEEDVEQACALISDLHPVKVPPVPGEGGPVAHHQLGEGPQVGGYVHWKGLCLQWHKA